VRDEKQTLSVTVRGMCVPDVVVLGGR